jgi:Na+/H+-dicarboxylate symporter
MKMTAWIIAVMPIAVWAFVTLFLKDLRAGLEMKSLALYLLCVVLANLIQAFVVLPLFLKSKGIAPSKFAKAMLPALSVAFFAKSSSAALPAAMSCAERNGGVSPKVAGFSLPLCTTINMNACAAFILITVLFVSMCHGMEYTLTEMGLWIVIATIAAIGNAGVPMGCYFLSGALLAAMNVPLNILGVILPFYTLIDMLESAINVWSDSCVTTVVDSELKKSEAESLAVNQYSTSSNAYLLRSP